MKKLLLIASLLLSSASLSLTAQIPVTPLVETFVGQWDPNSPSGMIGLDYMQAKYPDSFVSLLYHVDSPNGERPGLLTVSPPPYNIAKTPLCVINRQDPTDPYYGSSYTPMGFEQLWEKYREQDCPIRVRASLEHSAPNLLVAKVNVGFLGVPTSSLYRVAFVLVADGLTTEDFDSRSGYVSGQSNGYIGDDKYQGNGWEVYTKGTNPVTGIKYNSVVLRYDKPFEGRTLAIEPEQGVAYGLSKNYHIDELTNRFGDQIKVPNNAYRVVTIIIDGAGNYVSCAKSGYPDSTTDIAADAPLAKEVQRVVYHDVHGRQISEPKQGGLSIRTTIYTDGTREVSKIAPL